MNREEKVKCLQSLACEIISCQNCKLHKVRTKAVPGSGNSMAKILILGEGPGFDEDQQGLPFVGKSGQLLFRTINELGYNREDFFITNLVKCRPENNRDPEPEEIKSCLPFLEKQIDIIGPSVILSLGRYASQTLLSTSEGIGKLRGKWHRYRKINIMPTYHPSFILRSPNFSSIFKKDINIAIEKSKQ